MAYTLTGSVTIQCDTLDTLNTILDAATNNINVTSLTHDDGLLTINCNLNATG